MANAYFQAGGCAALVRDHFGVLAPLLPSTALQTSLPGDPTEVRRAVALAANPPRVQRMGFSTRQRDALSLDWAESWVVSDDLAGDLYAIEEAMVTRENPQTLGSTDGVGAGWLWRQRSAAWDWLADLFAEFSACSTNSVLLEFLRLQNIVSGVEERVRRSDWADCAVCGDEVVGGDVVLGRPCGHQFHPHCFGFFATANAVPGFGVRCPGRCGFAASVPLLRTEDMLGPLPAGVSRWPDLGLPRISAPMGRGGIGDSAPIFTADPPADWVHGRPPVVRRRWRLHVRAEGEPRE